LLFVLLVVTTFQSLAQQIVPDPTFNVGSGFGLSGGVVVTKLQSDGKILVGGYLTSFNGIAVNPLVRLNGDGSLDLSFNSIISDIWGVENIIIQPDGKILVTGATFSYGTYIVRLNADGSLDTSFNDCTCFSSGGISEIVLQSDGKIIAVGNFNGYIKRLNTNGSLDPSFDPGTSFDSYLGQIVLQPDGKIIVGGNFQFFNGVSRKKIARLNANGTLDLSFNVGLGTSSSTGYSGGVRCINLQPDGKILIGGDFDSFNGFNKRK
jgi:uncharacterized delta-60 repeat protein